RSSRRSNLTQQALLRSKNLQRASLRGRLLRRRKRAESISLILRMRSSWENSRRLEHSPLTLSPLSSTSGLVSHETSSKNLKDVDWLNRLAVTRALRFTGSQQHSRFLYFLHPYFCSTFYCPK